MQARHQSRTQRRSRRRGEVGSQELLMVILLFVATIVGLVRGIELGATYGILGQLIGAIVGPITTVGTSFGLLWLLYVLIVDPLDRFWQHWRTSLRSRLPDRWKREGLKESTPIKPLVNRPQINFPIGTSSVLTATIVGCTAFAATFRDISHSSTAQFFCLACTALGLVVGIGVEYWMRTTSK